MSAISRTLGSRPGVAGRLQGRLVLGDEEALGSPALAGADTVDASRSIERLVLLPGVSRSTENV